MKIRILVFGSTGMLGHMVLKVLAQEESFSVKGTHLADSLDLFYFDACSDVEKLDLIYEKCGGFDYFINCIGVTNALINESNADSVSRTKKINSEFPHKLAAYAENKRVRVIHISTDGVFSGISGPYSEDVPCDSADIYGKAKSLGEVITGNFLNIRCSIIGPSPFEKRGLFEWFKSQPQESTIQGYTNCFWNGVTTVQLACLFKKIIGGNHFDSLVKESPIHHFFSEQIVSKFELLTIFKEVLAKKITIVAVKKEGKGYPLKRILTTKYNSLKDISSSSKNIKDAVIDMLG